MQRDPEAMLREIEQSALLSKGPAARRIDRMLPEARDADPRAAVAIATALVALVVAGLAAS